jgi:hypothetical protein
MPNTQQRLLAGCTLYARRFNKLKRLKRGALVALPRRTYASTRLRFFVVFFAVPMWVLWTCSTLGWQPESMQGEEGYAAYLRREL